MSNLPSYFLLFLLPIISIFLLQWQNSNCYQALKLVSSFPSLRHSRPLPPQKNRQNTFYSHRPLSLSLTFSPQSSFLREESALAITHSAFMWLVVLFPQLHRNCSYWGSPMTLQCHIHRALFCHFSLSVIGTVHYWTSPPSSFPLVFMTWAPLAASYYSDHPCSVPHSLFSFADVLMLVNPRFYPWPISRPIVYVLPRYIATFVSSMLRNPQYVSPV